MMDISIVQNIFYIISSILFISGIKMLGKEDTAVKGNFLSALAMLVAVLVTFINVTNPLILIVGIGLGAVQVGTGLRAGQVGIGLTSWTGWYRS